MTPDPLLLAAGAFAAVGLVAVALALVAQAVTEAAAHERIAIYRFGQVHRVRGPGLVWRWPLLERLARIDMRPHKEDLALPAIQAANGAWIAASLRVDLVVLQPEKAAAVVRHGFLASALLELIEVAFREVAGQLPPERMVEARDRVQLGRMVKKVANETALSWGIDILSVEAAEIREIAAPAEGADPRWRVVVEAPGPDPIAVIRLVRQAAGLGLKEAKDLIDAALATLPADFGVEAASRLRHQLEQAGARASFRLPVGGPAGQGASADDADGEVVDVMLRATGDRVIEVIKALRRVTGWDLAHAKAVVEQAPYAIMHRARRADAEEVRRTLEAAGATVELV